MKLKNIKKISKVAIVASLFWSSPSLIGSNLFTLRNEVSDTCGAFINDIKNSNIQNVNFWISSDILKYDDPRFENGKTLPMVIIEAVKGKLINSGNACYIIQLLAGKYPTIINGCDQNGKNVLDYAILHGRIDFIELILNEPNFQLSVHDSNAERFLDIIIRSGKIGLLKKIIKNGLEEKKAPALLKYVQRASSHCLDSIASGSREYCLLAKNCYNLAIGLLNWIVEEANTRKEKELIDAVAESDLEKIRHLLTMDGLNINYQDRRGYTPLMWAVAMGDIDITRAILAKTPNLNLKNNEGKTVLDIAGQNSIPDIVRELAQATAR
ncbi:MAG: ankyrin repeat domain-containing protein [Puniceicoccales bacterium]|jgi:ankyrin repeat protein|nr:ankyrin repeat domain-containing protein [Puniceicoccales bacterium]